MFYRYELLSRVKVNHILNVFDSGDWEDGSRSGSKNKKLKDNIQLCKEHSMFAKVDQEEYEYAGLAVAGADILQI